MKVLKLNKGEEVTIIGNNGKSILVENKNNEITTKNIENTFSENFYIKSLSNEEEIHTFISTYNLESLTFPNFSSKLVNQLLEELHKWLCGDLYKTKEIKDFHFQIITEYE